MRDEKFRHIFLRQTAATDEYEYPGSGPRTRLPERQRAPHARRLIEDLRDVRFENEQRSTVIREAGLEPTSRLYLDVFNEPGYPLALKSLEDSRSDAQLVVVHEGTEPRATIQLPVAKLEVLEKKLRAYRDEDTRSGKPKNARLVAPISGLRLARLASLWTDREDLFPEAGDEIWWEVWLRAADDVLLVSFRSQAEALGISTKDRTLAFPNTRVTLAYGAREQFQMLIAVSDAVGELRCAKETASFFIEVPGTEASAWAEDLLARLVPPGDTAPRVCLHDSGVNRGHPLLRALIAPEDLHAIDPRWGGADQRGHGTGMAGLAAYGDLVAALAGAEPQEVNARLESVKILPPPPQSNEPELYGRISEQAVYRVESVSPESARVHLMAVTARDGRDQGRPSSWSAAIDNLAYGGDKEPSRLWVLAAGNAEMDLWGSFPEHLETSEIHDPGQSWNALTVGAWTEKRQIDELGSDGWEPVAQPGELSPYTTTSMTWQTAWPLKPDVVLEGGNVARQGREPALETDSLSLLTTYHRTTERLFTIFNRTSAASALAVKHGGQVAGGIPCCMAGDRSCADGSFCSLDSSDAGTLPGHDQARG